VFYILKPKSPETASLKLMLINSVKNELTDVCVVYRQAPVLPESFQFKKFFYRNRISGFYMVSKVIFPSYDQVPSQYDAYQGLLDRFTRIIFFKLLLAQSEIKCLQTTIMLNYTLASSIHPFAGVYLKNKTSIILKSVVEAKGNIFVQTVHPN